MTAHVEGLFEAVPPQGQRRWPGRRRQWQEVRPRQEGRGKHPHGKSRDGGADLADLQQLGRSQSPVIWGEWVPVAPVRQEMPLQSQHGLGCSVPPPFVYELWLGLGMSWLFFLILFVTVCFLWDTSMRFYVWNKCCIA